MRILIAPDKFKGSLDARGVAENIAAGFREILPNSTIEVVPMADGGEGTAEAICQCCHGEWVRCDAHDAIGRSIQAKYVWLGKSTRAVMEMSETAGLWRIPEQQRNPSLADTAGVAEMLLHATNHKAMEIIIGLGGSATNDGGFGLARVLGYRFFDHRNVELTNGPDELVKLDRIARPTAILSLPPIIAATDVRNPLLGDNGATQTFGPQKGARTELLIILEEALARLADIVAQDLGVDYRDVPGAGAAGGLGFGLMSFCGAVVRSGFEVVATAVDLESRMRKADFVVTGEGSLDRQTLNGKTPAGVSRIARQLDKPVFAIVGRTVQDRSVLDMFDGVLELRGEISETKERLRERARELANSFKQNWPARRPNQGIDS